mmetsp:Transcript_42517/g.99108  ORF Transcript_42517/g.99108 Transcript_42517/m.99108 type:complete len:261 (+) Transcript_42517:4360-5142(+)
MDREGSEVAVLYHTVFKEGVHVHLPHHVQVEGVPSHDVQLAHAEGPRAGDVAAGSRDAHDMAAVAGPLACGISLERDASGQHSHFRGILWAPVVAVLQTRGQRDRRATHSDNLPHLVLVVVRLIRPGSGDHDHLVTDFPGDLVLEAQLRGSRRRRGGQSSPRRPGAFAEDLQDSAIAHDQSFGVQRVRGPGGFVPGARESHHEAAGLQWAGGGSHPQGALHVDGLRLDLQACLVGHHELSPRGHGQRPQHRRGSQQVAAT